MKIDIQQKILPKVNEHVLKEMENVWEITLPEDYRQFLLDSNGGVPVKKEFTCNNHDYLIISFLCVLEKPEESEFGFYDIDVIESEIGERLTDNEDLVGVEVLPIAELFAGDYLCLDYRDNARKPCVCVWSHDESDEFDPVTYRVADSFSDFSEMLF